ncbi:uncharacterized protein Dyak_GE19199 [Drosophila yakuba]|uniref:Uncharacterized protein n=1 Tax=Drosophila yakuba TaxID=7245 RepID=B4P2T6_DROYA|nr:uncharacterized protein Dyak_GE19199 [Drosophila yakuba]
MWFVLYIFLALPLLVVAYLELSTFRRKKMLNKFKGPSGLPLVGNAHQMGKNPTEILDTVFSWWHRYGKDNFVFWIGTYSNVLVTSTKYLEFILSSQTLITKSDIYQLTHPWLGLGLLTSTGSKWHKHRKMITPAFHFNILQDFHEVMNENSTKFIKHLKTVAAGDNIFDFQDQAHYLTLDVICDTAMGVSINAMENRNSSIVQAFKDMCYNINMRAFHPLKRNELLYRLAPDYPAYSRTLKTLQDFTNEIIAKRIEAHKSGAISTSAGDEFTRKKMAFLDTLLSSTIDGRPLNSKELYEEVSTFMFEGHDTTTSGVSFAVFLLSRHQDEQRKLFEEQREVMGNSELGRDATFQDISQMKYLDLFIKEAQRVYPSVPFIGRFTEKDYVIDGDIVPKGTTLNLGLVMLGYNEKVFKDPHKFRPERFNLEKPGPFEYVPFSAGPRNCIGQKFALLEIKTVVSKIIRNFEVLPSLDELVSKDGYISTTIGLPDAERKKRDPYRHKYDPVLSAVLTLKSENGLYIRLKERHISAERHQVSAQIRFTRCTDRLSVVAFKMWFVLCAFLALPLFLVTYFEFGLLRRKRMLNKFQGPSMLPVVGNAHQMGKTPTEILNRFFGWWHEYNKDNFRYWIGFYSNIMVTSPKYMEFILSSNTLISKSDVYDLTHPWLGLGLLTSTGSKWHKHRKMITPAFHFNILQDFHEVMNENSTKFIDQLKKVADGGNIFDFQEEAHYFTLDVICDTAMGVSINAMENRSSSVVQAFKDITYTIKMRAFSPWKRNEYLFRFAPEYPEYTRTLKTLQDFTNEIIAKRIEVRKSGLDSAIKPDEFSRKKMAFLDTLLSSTVDGRPLTSQELYEEVSTFMFEGHDTTTSAVGFAVYLLSRHPDEQKKLFNEQCEVMGASGLGRDATFQEISTMKLLDLFIKEAQRLYPSVPFIGRFTEKDYVIDGDTVPKGTTLNLGLLMLGYNDRVFKDPHKFQPDRFDRVKPGPFDYVPFSAGPRNCIGQKFALLEIKTVVSKIIRNFEVLPALDELVSKDGYISTTLGLPPAEKKKRDALIHKYDPILSASMTLKSENGLHLRMKQRLVRDST